MKYRLSTRSKRGDGILQKMNRCFVFVCFFVEGMLCFHVHPLTHVHITDLGAAAGYSEAPPEQSPGVKVPCSRAPWQWLTKGGLSIPRSLYLSQLRPGNQTSDFQFINCDHFSSSALHSAQTNLNSIFSFSFLLFNSFLKVWFLKFLLRHFGFRNGDARAIKLSTCADIFYINNIINIF